LIINDDPYHDEDKMLLFKLTPYLTPQARANLHTYVYKGEDYGITYIYVTRPLAKWIVDHWVPEWIAPNIISITAFMFSITPLIVLLLTQSTHMDKTSTDMPSYIFFMEACMYPIYVLLDVMDGYQARKTKNSSPLGLLVDHGLDSYTCGFLLYFNFKMLGWGCNPQTLLLI